MRILYWGTPEYAVPTLLALHAAGHDIVGVVTQPDRRRGRGKQLLPSAIKVCAQSLGLTVYTPTRIKTDVDCQKQLTDLNADAFVVVAFGAANGEEEYVMSVEIQGQGRGELVVEERR